MESGSQPTDGPGSGGVGSGPGRPINPATQRPVREPAQREREPELAAETEPFSTDDLRRWEDARIGELGTQLASLSSVVEGQEVEIRAILRNELIVAFAVLLGAGAIFGLAREILKMKEVGNASEE